jgi:hypothetical protein
MTVALETTRFFYDGNGATAAFSFPVPFLDRASVEVRLWDTLGQLEIATGLNAGGPTGYQITGTEDPETGQFLNGGTVIFNSAPLSYWRVYLARKEPLTQEVALVDAFKFPASTVNTALDKGVMHAQRLADELLRTVRAPWTDLPPPADVSMELPSVANRAGGIMGFDSIGRPQVDGNFGLLLSLLGSTWTPSLSNISWVPTMAALRALDPPVTTAFVALTGYYAAGDKTTVLYRYDTGSTATDDGGLYIRPDSVSGGSPGRWIMLHDGTFRVVDWGADPTFTAPVDAQFAAWLSACMTHNARGRIQGGRYKFTQQAFWNLDPVATTGIHIEGDSYAAILDFTNVGTSPNLLIGGNTDLFKSQFKTFAVRGDIAGVVLQFGQDSYGADMNGTPLFHDPINIFTVDLEVDNLSASASAVAVRLNYVLNSPYWQMEANTAGAGDPVQLHQARFNAFHGSWSTGRCGVRYIGNGYSANNVFIAMDFENIDGYPIICDSINASNETWVGGTMVWERSGSPGGCFLMNAGNDTFHCIGVQPARYDALSIYPLAIGAKAAAVLFDTFRAGTLNIGALNVAPPEEDPADAYAVTIIPAAGNTGGLLIQRMVAPNTPRVRWGIIADNASESGGNAGTDLKISRFADNGIVIDDPLVIRRASGLMESRGGLQIQAGGKFGVGVPAIEPPAPAGDPNPATAGSGGAVLIDTAFTGGIGTTEWTIGDIVWLLKSLGLAPS